MPQVMLNAGLSLLFSGAMRSRRRHSCDIMSNRLSRRALLLKASDTVFASGSTLLVPPERSKALTTEPM